MLDEREVEWNNGDNAWYNSGMGTVKKKRKEKVNISRETKETVKVELATNRMERDLWNQYKKMCKIYLRIVVGNCWNNLGIPNSSTCN